jgi:hypothetical protein
MNRAVVVLEPLQKDTATAPERNPKTPAKCEKPTRGVVEPSSPSQAKNTNKRRSDRSLPVSVARRDPAFVLRVISSLMNLQKD